MGMDHNEVVKHYGAYVRSLAAQVRRQFRINLDMEDLVAFGNVGLLEAADRFDAKFGNNFLTFAHYRIKGAIYDGLRKMGILRGSDSSAATYGGGSNALLANVADRAGGGSPATFEDAVGEVADAVTGLAAVLAAVIASPENIPDPAETAEEKMEKEELRTKVQQAMQLLPEKERQLVEAYYFQGKTLEEAGALLGQSKSWSSRLHARAVARLQEILSEEVSGVAKPKMALKRGAHGNPHHRDSQGSPGNSEKRPQGRGGQGGGVQVRPGARDEEVTATAAGPGNRAGEGGGSEHQGPGDEPKPGKPADHPDG
jgi:RNA polymerase sigma factor for flagellar operon FliA